MLVNKAILAVLAAAAMLCGSRTDAAPSAFKVCGRNLSEIMSRVCHVYNSPSWDAPTVVEQPATALRRRRDTSGISDCCEYGCTWEQLSEYCSEVSANSDPDLSLDTYNDAPHDIKRSADSAAAEKAEVEATPPVIATAEKRRSDGTGAGAGGARREVGGTRSSGYGRGRRGRRGRRCECRRRRRAGRRRASLMGNMAMVENVTRAPPSIGTVSPLLTWGRTLNTDYPHVQRDRYAYIAVYST